MTAKNVAVEEIDANARNCEHGVIPIDPVPWRYEIYCDALATRLRLRDD